MSGNTVLAPKSRYVVHLGTEMQDDLQRWLWAISCSGAASRGLLMCMGGSMSLYTLAHVAL